MNHCRQDAAELSSKRPIALTCLKTIIHHSMLAWAWTLACLSHSLPKTLEVICKFWYIADFSCFHALQFSAENGKIWGISQIQAALGVWFYFPSTRNRNPRPLYFPSFSLLEMELQELLCGHISHPKWAQLALCRIFSSLPPAERDSGDCGRFSLFWLTWCSSSLVWDITNHHTTLPAFVTTFRHERLHCCPCWESNGEKSNVFFLSV